MARYILFVAFCIFCKSVTKEQRQVAQTIQVISFGLGGSQVTFSDVFVGKDEIAKCQIKSVSTQNFITAEPLIMFNQTGAICRIHPNIKMGRVEVDFEIHRSTLQIYSRTFFINPAPKFEVQVEERWETKQVVLAWNPDYFKQFFDPGATILLQASILVATGDAPNYQPTEVAIVAGINTAGTAKATVSDKAQEIISQFRFPYFYILRPVGTQTANIFQVSELFTPTLGIDETIAKDVCTSWQQNASYIFSNTICPPCLCKAKLDKNFEPVEYPAQILKLSKGKLYNHILYYEKVSQEPAQTCSYNKANDNLATVSPAQAGWTQGVSKHESYEENYFSDIWPYIVCCLQTNSADYCTDFHKKRPMDTGHGYPGPGEPCSGTEDPHMTTFDGVRYDFMGWGEFWLIKGPSDSRIGLQGRMAPKTSTQGVSYYQAIALRDGKTKVQIDLKESAFRVLMNGEQLIVPAQGLTLPYNEIYLTVSAAKAELKARSGFIIEVNKMGGHLNLFGYGAAQNKGKYYRGIFGNFDGNATNDLTTQTGFVIENTSANLQNLSLIHNVFGMSWMTTEEESYFFYEDGMGWANYTNGDFGPIFSYPNPEDMPEEVRKVCGSSLACYYEYIGTGDLGDAKSVADQEKEYDDLKEEIDKKIFLCEKPQIPRNGRVDVEGYLNGSQAIYSCNEEYDIVSGSDRRTCIAGENKTEWVGSEPECTWTCTKCLPETVYQISPDPNYCAQYYLCINGERFLLKCPWDEYFSNKYLACMSSIECEEGCY